MDPSFEGDYHGEADLSVLRHQVLHEELSRTEKGEVVLVWMDPMDYNHVLKATLASLVGTKEKGGVVISVDKPCVTLSRYLEDARVPQERLSYMEATTVMKDEHAPTCVPVNPRNLTELSVEAGRLLRQGEVDFGVLASLSSLRELNDRRSTVEFVHHWGERSREEEVLLVILAIKGTRDGTMRAVMPFCDQVVEIGSDTLREKVATVNS